MSLSRVVAVSKAPDIHKLARSLGAEVYAADNIAEAHEIIKRARPELVLFDRRTGSERTQQFIEHVCVNSHAALVVLGDHEKHAQVIAKLAGARKTSPPDSTLTPPDSSPDVRDETFFAEDFAASLCLVGKSTAMRKTIEMIKLVAASRCNPVLVAGETGTGKELAARAVHQLRHPDAPFVAVNCAALTANLLESELFGHEKGAFTGASSNKTGLLELACNGTLFLDEVSEMPLDLQAKLLRVLQERTFRKVGGTKDLFCRATIIASSNRNLLQEVQENRFRRDLYYRINVSPIIMPALASPGRRKDIPLLTEFFIKTSDICPHKRGKITSVTKLAMEALIEHGWPGNVRELRNVVDRAILLESTDKIGLGSIIIDPSDCGDTSSQSRSQRIKDFSLATAEKELIARALKETGWQKTRAAALLGITRATLYAKVKQYDIEKSASRDEHKPAEAEKAEPLVAGF